VQVQRHWVWYAGCDPSVGKGKHSDPSAIVVGAWCTDLKKLHIEIAASKRRVMTKLQADMIVLQREYPIVLWAFENNGAFEHTRQALMAAALSEKVVMNLRGVTATSQAGPEVWIDGMEPHINLGRIVVKAQQAMLLEQLRDWPNAQPHHHFDLLVALYLCWAVAATGAGSLPQIGLPTQRTERTYRGY
jgi:hypothetical protein